MEDIECLGIDCAWCLDKSCILSKTDYENEDKQNVDLVQRWKT